VADFPADEFRLDGDPGGVRSSAAQWTTFGNEATAAASQIRSLDTSLFLGPEGDQYRQGLNDKLPPHLDVTGQAYSKVGTALNSYATALSGLQDRMRPLAAKAPGLWQELQAAQGRLSSAQAADQRHDAQVRADALTRPADETPPPDTYHSGTGAATANLSAAQQAWNDCLNAARQIKTDLRTAIDQATHAIHDAADMRFKHNPHGFGALVASVGDFVKDHVADLAKLSGVLKSLSGLTATVGHFLYNGFAHVVNGLASFGNALIHHPGDLLLTIGGMLLFDVSAGGEGLGLVLDATGVGAVIGVPANVVSAAGMTAGLTMMAAGAGDAARHAASDDNVSPMSTESGSGSGPGSVNSPDFDGDLSQLRPGRSPDVYEVDTPDELKTLFTKWSQGGEPVHNSYPGELVRLPDGSTVGLRGTSRSGGPTIDLTRPGRPPVKVHLP
jgi:hypothetical protein